jgi:quercetin dioxygenase-like cupin family protein
MVLDSGDHAECVSWRERMSKRLVFKAKDVVGFASKGLEHVYVSRMLVDQESVGSERLVMNHFILKGGQSMDPGTKPAPSHRHPPPFDELYYVLSGQGILFLNESGDPYELSPGTVAFVPAGVAHSLSNRGTADLEMITIMPGPLTRGANPLYDERKDLWGTSFRLEEKREEK